MSAVFLPVDPDGVITRGPFVRNPWNYDQAVVSVATGLDCSGDEVLTKQAPRDECDINVIVARFGLTGRMPQVTAPPMYGDFTGVSDYRTAIDAVRAADAEFMRYPAQVRARFENDPQKLLEFMADPANAPEARQLGFLAEEVSTPSPAPIVPPAPDKALS